MAYTPALLASGQLANAKGTLYTVPTGFRARVTCITYYNTTGGALTVSTYIDDGTSRQIDSRSVPAASRYIALDSTAELLLDAADKVEGNTSSNTSVNYHVFGWEEQKG